VGFIPETWSWCCISVAFVWHLTRRQRTLCAPYLQAGAAWDVCGWFGPERLYGPGAADVSIRLDEAQDVGGQHAHQSAEGAGRSALPGHLPGLCRGRRAWTPCACGKDTSIGHLRRIC